MFSLDTFLLMVIYHQTEFGFKRLISLELIQDIVETIILLLYKPPLWPWPWRQNPNFCAWQSSSCWCITAPSLVQKGCLKTLNRLGTNICLAHYGRHCWRHRSAFPLAGKQSIAHSLREFQSCCRKSADVDSYVRVGWKSKALAESSSLCSRYTTLRHHVNNP